MRRPEHALAALVLIAGIGLGAWALWPTKVPDDLKLPPLDERDIFDPAQLREAQHFEMFLHWNSLASMVVVLVVLGLYAWRGHRLARESAAGRIGTGMLLGMLGLAIAWLVHVPFALASHWWQRRWDQNDLSYLDWLFEDWALLAAEFLSICVALLIVMGLARWLGERWWLPGAGVFVGIAALFSFAAPYLYSSTTPLEQKPLLEAASTYERKLGLGHIPLRVEEVSADTDQANAFAFGLGPSRRVVFWDTILEPPFTEAEQRVVLAHELAHHSQRHLPKGIGWFALFAIPGAWILMRATRGRGGMGEPTSVPLALFVVAVLQLATAPVSSAISRRMEAEADWKALTVTHDPAALEGLMVEFSKTGLGDPDPPFISQLVFGTHPTLADRVAMARAFADRR